MNISLSAANYGGKASCQYEGFMPWDEDSQVLVSRCSEDDFIVEISSQVYGGHILGVNGEGEFHEIQDINRYRSRREKSIDEEHEISDDLDAHDSANIKTKEVAC